MPPDQPTPPREQVKRVRGLPPIIGAFFGGHRPMDAQTRRDLLKFASAACGAAGFMLICLLLIREVVQNNKAMLEQINRQNMQERVDHRQEYYLDRTDRTRDACLMSRAVDAALRSADASAAALTHSKTVPARTDTPSGCWSNWTPPIPPTPPSSGAKQ